MGQRENRKRQGGKLGNSNRDSWGYHDEEKIIAKKQRRLEQKRLILDETSKIEANLREQANNLIQILNEHQFKFEIHEFDSGAAMIDIWIDKSFYCIQMAENKFGWSKIEEDMEFCTIPESGYLEWNEFKNEFDQLIQKHI